MKYEINGKKVNISDEEMEKNMRIFNLTKEEYIQMWLEDEGYLENEEQETLVKKTKNAKIKMDKKPRTTKETKEKRKSTKKVDTDKKDIINFLFDALNNGGYENLAVTNETKVIEFDLNGSHYKVDLVKQRQKKES